MYREWLKRQYNRYVNHLFTLLTTPDRPVTVQVRWTVVAAMGSVVFVCFPLHAVLDIQRAEHTHTHIHTHAHVFSLHGIQYDAWKPKTVSQCAAARLWLHGCVVVTKLWLHVFACMCVCVCM